jgi:transcriptional regulator with XRE-family HTH domain/phage FluMu protein Com
MKCPKCGAPMKEATIKEYDAAELMGVSSVSINGFRALRCTKCGDVLLGGTVIEQAETMLAMAIISRGDVLSGERSRFLRKYMELSQAALAEQLGIHRVTLARWETDAEPIATTASIAIRALAVFKVMAKVGVDSKKLGELFRAGPGEAEEEGFRLDVRKAS